MMIRLVISLLLALASSAVALAQGTTAEDQALAEAKRHFEAGKNAYTAGDYQTAIREFKAAEALRPSATLAYNIGLANEKLGKRRVALKYYKRYLEGAPNASNRPEVEGRIATLERDIAASPTGSSNPSQTERPSDMPPEMPPTSDSGYHPPASASASAQPPGAQSSTLAKKRNLWWVWMIVGLGSATLLAVIIGVSVWAVNRHETVWYDDGTSTALQQSLTAPPASNLHRAPDTANLTIRF